MALQACDLTADREKQRERWCGAHRGLHCPAQCGSVVGDECVKVVAISFCL
jgi:hypothetical protein